MDNTNLIPISSLQERYGLSSRQAVYDRIAALKIEAVARGKLSSEQVDKLDKLDKFLSSNPGAAIADFPREAEISPVRQLDKPDLSSGQLDKFNLSSGQLDKPDLSSGQLDKSNLSSRQLDKSNLSSGQLDKPSDFIELVKEIANVLSTKTPQVSPAKRLASLEKIANNGWLISTAEVKQLIGTKPSGERFTRGSFAFIRSGKIGGQNAWKVIRAIP